MQSWELKKKNDPYFQIFWVGRKRANKYLFILGLVSGVSTILHVWAIICKILEILITVSLYLKWYIKIFNICLSKSLSWTTFERLLQIIKMATKVPKVEFNGQDKYI